MYHPDADGMRTLTQAIERLTAVLERSGSQPFSGTSTFRPTQYGSTSGSRQHSCASCGQPALSLKFEPKGNRPLYCNDCYHQRQQRAG